MKKLPILLISLVALLGFGFVASPGVLAQSPQELACTAADGTWSGSECKTNNGKEVKDVVKLAVTILSWAVGVASLIMIVIGGIRYATSGGDANAISGAKNTLLYAVVGLVIAILAQAIVRFVYSKAT